MKEGRALVTKGQTYVDVAGNEFNEITISINNISIQVQDVAESVKQISVSTETMLHSITEASTISKESAGYAQSVAASAEEQNATME